MKRDQRKALLKQARLERSRREHNATLMANAIAQAKRMDAERAHRIQLAERQAARQATPTLFEGVMDYMRSMGVGPIVIDATETGRIKSAVVIDNEHVRVEQRDNGDGTGTNIVTPKHPAKMIDIVIEPETKP